MLPGATVGRDNHLLAGCNDHVYVTPDEEIAEFFAHEALGSGRPRVLTVSVCGDVFVDQNGVDGGWEAYRCEAAFVLSVRLLDRARPPVPSGVHSRGGMSPPQKGPMCLTTAHTTQ